MYLLNNTYLHQDHGLQVAAREVQQSNSARTIQLLYSAAKASHYSSALEVLATSKRVLDDLPAMQPSLVRQLLWALAILNLKPRAVLDRLKAAMAATGESLWPCIQIQQEGDMTSKNSAPLLRQISLYSAEMQLQQVLGAPDTRSSKAVVQILDEALCLPPSIWLWRSSIAELHGGMSM